MSTIPESTRPRIRWLPLFTAASLLVIVTAIGNWYDYIVRFGGPFIRRASNLSYTSDGEYRLWLVFFTLLVPAGMLIAYAFTDWLELGRARLVRLWLEHRPRRLLWPTLAAVCGLAALYRLGRWVLLRDYMITDDETIIRFGGQVFAMGQLMAERLWPPDSVTEAFTYTRDGRVMAADWPGGLLVAAFAELTQTGPWIYALLAAASAWAVAAAAHHLLGPRGALIALALWLISPMVWSLSLTMHTHLVSRAGVAFGLLAAVKLFADPLEQGEAARLSTPQRVRWALLLGACVGYSFLSRPFETAAMMGPCGLFLTYRAFTRGREGRRQFVAAAATLLPMLGLYCAYNYAQTGNPFLTPRGANWQTDKSMMLFSTWERAGQNLGFNVLMLAIWFQGLVGLPLAWLGWYRAPRRLRAVAALLWLGIVCQLLLALGHSDLGIHIVGPIHYSEAAPPLTLLATLGVAQTVDWLANNRLPLGWLRSLSLGYLGGVAAFGGIFALSLYSLGEVTDIPHRAVRQAGISNAIVVAPPPAVLERLYARSSGTWQVFHAPPHPRVDDDVFFVEPNVDLAALRKAFPTREVYELVPQAKRRSAKLERLAPGDLPRSRRPKPKRAPGANEATPPKPKLPPTNPIRMMREMPQTEPSP